MTPAERAAARLPSAREVREAHLTVEIGVFAVRYQTLSGRQTDRFKWLLYGPAGSDGCRESLDEFDTYREAISAAKLHAKAHALLQETEATTTRSVSSPSLLEMLGELEFVGGDDLCPTPLCHFCGASGPDRNPAHPLHKPADPHEADCPLALALGRPTRKEPKGGLR